jgi:hypothetical protein
MTISGLRRRVSLASIALALVFPLTILTPSLSGPARANQPAAQFDGASIDETSRPNGIGRAVGRWLNLVDQTGPTVRRSGAATPAAGAMGPSSVALVPDRATKIRDRGGDTDGNGDWMAHCGETIEYLTWIDNIGSTPATGVVATISTNDPYLEVLYNDRSTFPDIAPGHDALGDDDWDLGIADVVPDLYIAHLTMEVVTDSLPPATLTYTLLIHCDGRPADHDVRVSLGRTTIDDGVLGDSTGNNDGGAKCGETIELYVGLENTTDAPINGVSVRLSVDDPALTLLYNDESEYPKIPPGRVRENSDDWDLRIADIGTNERIVNLTLTISTPAETYERMHGFMVYCEPGMLSPWHLELDDGPTGDSIGNGDGEVQCGETVEIKLELANVGGDRPITGARAVFIPKDPALTVLYNSRADYPDIVRGWSSWGSSDWDIEIGAVPDGHRARFDVVVQYDGTRTWRTQEQIIIGCDRPPPIFVTNKTVDDGVAGDSIGNNDGRAHCGELIELYLRLENASGRHLDGFEASLSTDDPNVTLLYNTGSPYPSLADGAVAENTSDWDIRVGEGFPDRHQAVFTLTIEALDLTLDVPVTLRCDA